MTQPQRRQRSPVRDAPYVARASEPVAGVVVIDDEEGFRVVPGLGGAESMGHLLCKELGLGDSDPTCLVQRVEPVGYYTPICAWMNEDNQHDDFTKQGTCSNFIGDLGLTYIHDRPKRVVIVRQNTEHGPVQCLTPQDIAKLKRRYDRFLKNEALSEAWERGGEESEEEPEYEQNSASDFEANSSLEEDDEM